MLDGSVKLQMVYIIKPRANDEAGYKWIIFKYYNLIYIFFFVENIFIKLEY